MIIYVYIYIYIFHSFNYSNTYLDHRISARERVPKNKLSFFFSSVNLSLCRICLFSFVYCYATFFFWTSHRSNLKKRFKYNKEYTCYEAEADYKKEIDY